MDQCQTATCPSEPHGFKHFSGRSGKLVSQILEARLKQSPKFCSYLPNRECVWAKRTLFLLSPQIEGSWRPLLPCSQSKTIECSGERTTSLFPLSQVTLATWVIGFFVIGVNCYFLGSLGIEYLRTSELHTGLVVLIGIIMFASMFVYLVSLRPHSYVITGAPPWLEPSYWTL